MRLREDATMRHQLRTQLQQEWHQKGVELYATNDIPEMWPPICGPPCNHQHCTPVGKAAAVDEYFEKLEGLAHRIQTCTQCLQRQPHHGTPLGGAGSGNGASWVCRNCKQYPNGHQQQLAKEVDMDPAREPDPVKRAAKLEWEQLQRHHGPLLPMEESLLAPVLCFVKVGHVAGWPPILL